MERRLASPWHRHALGGRAGPLDLTAEAGVESAFWPPPRGDASDRPRPWATGGLGLAGGLT
jgi:hypothetical protein